MEPSSAIQATAESTEPKDQSCFASWVASIPGRVVAGFTIIGFEYFHKLMKSEYLERRRVIGFWNDFGPCYPRSYVGCSYTY